MIRRTRTCLFFATALAVASLASAEVKLHALFSDHMVLQRGRANPLWGSATPGATIEAKVDGAAVAHAKADDDGKFTIKLPELAEGTPHTIELTGDGAAVTLSDVLAGDVWVCSGQSNMGMNVNSSANRDAEIAAANFPNLRLFTVPNVPKADPVENINAQPWTAATPKTVPNFSAAAYFFGRKLNQDLNVPIGLIHTSWGGTPAEAWTPLPKLEALADDGLREVKRVVENRKIAASPDGATNARAAKKQYDSDLREWMKKTGRFDEGPTADAAQWDNEDFDDSSWKRTRVPADWVAAGEANGCVWFRKTIDVPADRAGQALTLSLGLIDDTDITFFNGQEVGRVDQTQPLPWSVQRRYTVPANLVKPGRNVIAVRIFDTGGGAGFIGQGSAMQAQIGETKIPLAGEWKSSRESTFDEAAVANVPRPQEPLAMMQLDNPNAPSSLYNGMIRPLGAFGIKGAIWYQGESNASRHQEYERLLTTMIGAWRDQFDQGDFPFYIVGLANFTAPTDDPNKFSDWAMLRDAQRSTAAHVKHAGMTVTIDVGEERDIHPKNKQAVGERLALMALKETYGKQIVSRGPTLKDAHFDDGKVLLTFDDIGGGLKLAGEKPSFALAGADGKFVWAKAELHGTDSVVLIAPGLAQPTKVKYAFAQNPPVNLTNAEGLPAEPFMVEK